MLRSKRHYTTLLLGLVLLGSLLLTRPSGVAAGIFNASNQVTYKEYWVHHNQFTGSCNDDGSPTHSGGTWFTEPERMEECPKTLSFTLPDDFTNALKVEVYLDLWRAYDERGMEFNLNDGPTIYKSPVGSDWSRTPWVLEVDKSELDVGANTITLRAVRPTHIHDIGFRVYYNNENPLVPAPGSDVEPPTGQLLTIQDDSGPVAADAGGTLMANGDQLKLTAEFSADTAYIEFHAWYEGYDEDNDGTFRDWHNSGRNNWWPGGREEIPTGGTINHIATVKPKGGATTATVTWNIAHVTNQPLIKFKIRLVDAAGNVREAAGGPSADFKLMRDFPVNAFTIHGFADAGLHMDGRRPPTASYNFTMPPTIESYFTQAYLVGAYWRNPNFSLNSAPANSVSAPDWALGIKQFNKNFLLPGLNRITYIYNGSGSGQFVEEPGPMFVLRRTTAGSDSTPPAVSGQVPIPNATNVDVKSAITAYLGDDQYGVDWTTVKFTIDGEDATNKTQIQGVMGNYRLVYDPPDNLYFDSTYEIKIEGCDLLGNCMSPVTYQFTTSAPDTTEPNVSNIVAVPLPNGANVTWNTNEPATTYIKYGKTNNYELGVIESETLKTAHAVEIRGLQPDTLYHFRIKAVDEQGNSGESPDQTFTTTEFGNLLSDDFNACQLNTELWTPVLPGSGANQPTYFMDGEQLELTIPGGTAHDWSSAPGAPRFMQLSNGSDFEVEIKFASAIAAVGQMQGLVVEEDADTFVRFGFEQHPSKGPILFTRFVSDGVTIKDATREFNLLVPPLTSTPPLLKVTRSGDTWSWYWKASEADTKWTRANNPFTFSMNVLKVGFFGGNTGQTGSIPAHKTIVDYFFNSALPIIPEDGNPMNVNINVVGTGTVTKLPDKSPYICGEQVVLSAATVPGWSFAGWSGDESGTAPTVGVTIDSPKNITATFTQDQYLLNVVFDNDGVGGGGNVVTRNPDKPTYIYGDVVQLTAVPEPGWTFVSWSGAATGTAPTISVTMYESETVTAHFRQNQYDLDVNIVNDGIGAGGTVTITPLKSTYVYGDVVTLRANVNTGWTFGGWSGAVTSAEVQTQVTITGDTSVTATFIQDRYDLNVEIVSLGKAGVGGIVTLNPNRTTFVYNEQVTLVAQANACWTFTRWEGDLSGSNPVELLTVTRDTNVKAVFTQNRYTLNVNTAGPGTVDIEPQLAEYYCGDQVTLTATPAANFFFTGWTGDLTGADNPLTFAIGQNTTVTANFSNNPPPTVDPIADKTARPNQLVTFQVRGVDPRGEAVTLSAQGLPPGATFVDNGGGNGTFTWRPGVNQVGEYEVTFIASDGTGQGSQTVKITVTGAAIVLPLIIR